MPPPIRVSMPDHVELTFAERRAAEADSAAEQARRRRQRAHRIERSRQNRSLMARILRRLGLVY
jgi:hypothetical protein